MTIWLIQTQGWAVFVFVVNQWVRFGHLLLQRTKVG